MNISSAFRNLATFQTGNGDRFYVVELTPGPRPIYVACTWDGRPAIFIAIEPGGSPGVKLLNLELLHNAACDLRTSDGRQIAGIYSLVECLSHDVRLQGAFLDLVSELLVRDGKWADSDELESDLFALIELFRGANGPGRSSWIGTWGELFVIHQSRNRELVLAAWHVDPYQLHDFVLGASRVECKATVGNRRIHEFNLEQVDCPEIELFVVSLMTYESVAGVTALELYDEIRSSISDQDLRNHLDLTIVRMLGQDFDALTAPRFDYDAAVNSVRVFAAADVPAPVNNSPDLINSVRFRSDLSGCTELDSEGGGVPELVYCACPWLGKS